MVGVAGFVQAISPAAVIEYHAPLLQIAEAHEESSLQETIEEKITRISSKWGIEREHLYNLVECESNFNPLADNGEDRGLVQINRKHWPEITDEQAFDPDFSLNFAAEMISKGEGYQWVCGNCYAYSEVLTDYKLPRMIEIVPNEVVPRVGSIAIFRYKNEKHIAVIEKVVEDGIWIREANFKPYSIGTRLIPFDDKNLKGFYRP